MLPPLEVLRRLVRHAALQIVLSVLSGRHGLALSSC